MDLNSKCFLFFIDGAHYDHQWLESFARGAMNVYSESILKITMVTDLATRQLTADIG